jgi:hypothetical protein
MKGRIDKLDFIKLKTSKVGGQVAECLSNKCEALSSNPNTANKIGSSKLLPYERLPKE